MHDRGRGQQLSFGKDPSFKSPGVAVMVDPGWNPDHGAVWAERNRAGQIVMVRHPTLAYVAEIKDGWQAAASGYVRALHDGLKDLAGRGWLPALWGSHEKGGRLQLALQWLPLDDLDPRHSRKVLRNARHGQEVSLVLLGCLSRQDDKGAMHPLYGGEGIRLIGHIDSHSSTIRFTSFATTLPPFSQSFRVLFATEGDFFPTLALRIANAFGLPPIGIDGFSEIGVRIGDRPDRDESYEVLVKTVPDRAKGEAFALSHGLVAKIDSDSAVPVARYPLVTFADLQAMVFSEDPMTSGGPSKFDEYRPNRSWANLDPARTAEMLKNLLAGQNGTVQLADESKCYKVVNSEFVPEDLGLSRDDPKEVLPELDDHSRTNQFAAVTACYHVDELFGKMRDFGIDPGKYFRFAELPLTIRYRAGIIPGPGRDGLTINAQALWLAKPMADDGVLLPGALEARFALADLQSSPELSPMGAVTDQRWCWHEFSHVLIGAATGELEYRFAHSSGDAMGAILCDPLSALATDAAWRSVTFPWLSVPARRHDRKARDGWSWCGSLYGKERVYAHGLCDRRGYWSEQMLSTTLFNIYRSLGGDTGLGSLKGTPTADVREAAAAYTLCLIMQANAFLGPASVLPVNTPDGFVTALISADLAVQVFEANGTKRCGGSAHKVIRWAFENQGLYQTGGVQDAPGAPPDVDIFIDDQRDSINTLSATKAPMMRGGYDPAPLDTTKWHASEQALWIRAEGGGDGSDGVAVPARYHRVYARVRNRGRLAAAATTVTVWSAEVVASTIPPWPDPQWKQLQGPSKPADIGPGKGRTFGPFKWTPPHAAGYALVVIATCPVDPSNADLSVPAPLPCATLPGRTDYLIACDNNMGLRLVQVL
jgi:hypothetical protein